MDIDIDALESAAHAATPGPWTKRTHTRMPSFVQAPRLDTEDPYDIEVLGEDEALYPTREADCDFIAAANPAVVLELLSRLKAAEVTIVGLAIAARDLAAESRNITASHAKPLINYNT